MWQALRQAMTQLGSASPALAGAAVLMYALSVLMVGLRWQRILLGMGNGLRVSVRDTVITHLSSIFVNNVTPGRVAGELFRIAMLQRYTGIETKLVVASVGYDRLTDVIPIALLIALSLPTLRQVVSLTTGQISLVYWGLLGLALLLVFAHFIGRMSRVRRFLQGWRERLASIKVRRRDLLLALVCGFLLWGQDLVRLILVAAALHVALNPWQAIPLSMVALLGGLVPTIGGLGVVEGGLTAALCLFGVGLNKALAITALERGISYVLATGIGGLVLLCVGGGELWRHSRKGESK
jgi:uncharacterized membrane protein YbhN (UPF0104 family)